MFQRLVNPLKSNSFFIFGPRGSGKSTFIEEQFLAGYDPNRIVKINLLRAEDERRFLSQPSLLESILSEKIPSNTDWVFIDEVQKVPALLDYVHLLIESKKLKFILTGSSARKLKKGAANLLAGRAFVERLFSLSQLELGQQFQLIDCLEWGSLPKIFHLQSEEEKRSYLNTYCHTYLKEEILQEQLTRRGEAFYSFLELAAQMNGKIVHYAKIAKPLRVDPKTVQSFFEILEDTLVGFLLRPHHASFRKSLVMHPKFYFFDPGVKRALSQSLHSRLVPGSSAFGEAFEHWVILEIQRINHYKRLDYQMEFLCTKDNAEIDLVLRRGKEIILIEIKSSKEVDPIEVRKLSKLGGDYNKAQALYYLSQDAMEQTIEKVKCLPWYKFLEILK